MPCGKLSWQASATDLFWASISRAVRSPPPFDTDVVELAGTTVTILMPRDRERP